MLSGRIIQNSIIQKHSAFMKKALPLIFCSFFILSQLIAQNEDPSIEYGILLSARIDSDDNFKFEHKGFGIESGFFILNSLGEKISMSIDFRLAYSQRDQAYENAISPLQMFNSLDTIRILRSGILNYKSLSLSLPIKFRFKILQDQPFFLLAGINPYLKLWARVDDNYDEIELDRINNIVLSERLGVNDEIKQNFFNKDLILAGFGFQKNKIIADIYFSGGGVDFDDDFFGGFDKFSIVFNLYYRLNK